MSLSTSSLRSSVDGAGAGVLQGSQRTCYHHKTNIAVSKGEDMRKSLFSLEGINTDDFDEISSAWDQWVTSLFRQGFYPGESPLAESTDTDLWYQLLPVGGLNDFNEHLDDNVVVIVAAGAAA